ncbi:hypothetical protein D9M71_391840 [compost metagenome]
MRQFHFQQVGQLGPGLELAWHVIVKHPYSAFCFDLPQIFKLHPERAWIKRFLRGQALLFTGHVVAAQFAEMALEQVAIDQRITVVERQ